MQEQLFSPPPNVTAKASTLRPQVIRSRDGSRIVIFGEGCKGVAYFTFDQFAEFVFEAKKGKFDEMIRSGR